jgi:hypothetical protein
MVSFMSLLECQVIMNKIYDFEGKIMEIYGKKIWNANAFFE